MAYGFLIVLCAAVTIALSKPIMVSFGTNKGPIVPATPISSTSNPLAPRNAAPVFERVDDIPNPHPYKAPTPNQYRKQILSFKPNPNLILGTPLDIKYALNDAKYDLYTKKANINTNGVGYTGPQVFGKQIYEIEREKKKNKRYESLQTGQSRQLFSFQRRPEESQRTQQTSQPSAIQSVRATYPTTQRLTNAQQYQPTINKNQAQPTLQAYQPQRRADQYQQGSYSVNEGQHPQHYYYQYNQNDKVVPEIGIIYSAGLRYYVPQISYYNNNNNNANSDSENSVYENQDNKYVYNNQKSQSQYKNNY